MYPGTSLSRIWLIFSCCFSCCSHFTGYLLAGATVLINVRAKRRRRNQVLPRFYLTPPLSQEQLIGLSLILFLALMTLLGVGIFLRVYVFTADVKLIYLDTMDDYVREIETGNSGIRIFGWKYWKTVAEGQLFLGNNTLQSLVVEKDYFASGYWMLNHKISHNGIRVQDFQFQRAHEVTLAIRFYAYGDAHLALEFEDVNGERSSPMSLYGDRVKLGNLRAGLCTHFVRDLPFDRLLKKIDIVGVINSPKAFIIIEKIIITVGNDNRSLHMLYTLIPANWCSGSHQNNLL